MTNKCDTCLNSRPILSENGWHSSCCLSDRKAFNCLTGKKDHYIGFRDKGEQLRWDFDEPLRG